MHSSRDLQLQVVLKHMVLLMRLVDVWALLQHPV
jgi:hypothetical protein